MMVPELLMLAGERPRCSSLKIREVGRGIVYFGSARFEPGTPLYEKAKDLARRLAATLQCPSWSGGGKGIMGAVTHGAIHGCVRRATGDGNFVLCNTECRVTVFTQNPLKSSQQQKTS